MSKNHIVFLHGFLENSSMWKPVLNRISKTPFEIHLPELPGHGNRAPLPAGARIEDFADDVLSQLPLEKSESVIFIGHSMGGYVACNIARRYPQKIKALCLFHSKAGCDDAEKKAARDRAVAAAEENKALYLRTMISGLFSSNSREKLHDTIESMIEEAKQMEVAAIQNALMAMKRREDEVETLINRDFPLFYFLGDQDPSLPMHVMESELQRLPGAAYLVVPGIGHMGHFENTSISGEFIQRILRSLNA